MIDLAVSKLQNRLRELAWLDLVGGIARQQKLLVGDKEKTLPAMVDPEDPGRYLLLVPSSDRSGISYFEVRDNRKLYDLSGGRAFMMSATVRVVVWLNTQRIAPAAGANEAFASVVSKLSGSYSDVSPISNISVTPMQEVPRGPEIFSRWTYDEAETQFLMLPFEYFAFDFEMNYVLSAGCAVGNIVRTEIQC